MNLEKRASLWVSERIIEQAQADAILKFEARTPRASWAMYGVAGIGVTALMAGVVSIIAANWQYISQFGKLFAYFVVLAGFGTACIKLASREGVMREVALTLFGLFVLAGIGLIAQVFHVHGDGWGAVALWIALILPVALLARNKALPNVWFAGFYGALFLWASSGVVRDIETDRIVYAVGAMYLSVAAVFACYPRIPLLFLRACTGWAVMLGLLAGGISASGVWSAGNHYMTFPGKEPTLFVLVAIGLSFAAVLLRSQAFPPGVARAAAAAIVSSAVLIVPTLTTLIERDHDILGCFLFLVPWTCVAVGAAIAERKRLFDFAAFVIGARFVGVYFQVFGSLAATGFGLILSGGLILFAAYSWHRYRAKVADIIRGEA